MKFFLDTANLDEIRRGASPHILDGVRANPAVAAKKQKRLRERTLFERPPADRRLESFPNDCGRVREVPGEITAPEAARKGAR